MTPILKNTIVCQIFQKVNTKGNAEFGYRIFDDSGKIILTNRKNYSARKSAVYKMESAVDQVKNKPENIHIKTTSSKKYYFNVVDYKGIIIGKQTAFYTSKSACSAEISRLKNILLENTIRITDNKYYGIHQQIKAIYTNSFQISTTSYKTKIADTKKILSLIDDFDKEYPTDLFKNNLTDNTNSFQSFISNSNSDNFNITTDAFQNIFDYFDSLNGENEDGVNHFQLTDFASIQSSHLYMQAAGSTGEDSTEGVHLRWMLKGGLANHLPKANYAQAGINFNKINDYVRIYKAPYRVNIAKLDFSFIPTEIDNNEAIWTYVNAKNVFFVRFQNIAKYAQALQAFDPQNRPLNFMRAYGNGIIEIEHKTELSFAITPKFVETAGNSELMIELLSVENNKITAPKAATFRKKSPLNQMNDKKIFSENIRSVRLKVKAGFLSRIDFELYSDFIAATNLKSAFRFIGKYALTKNTAIAHQRLEPVVNSVNGNWRRYNNGALVNVNNYKEKWNGDNVEPENRIRNTVDTFINLSNDPTNPTAIEQIPINHIGVVDDPENDPADREFELSNLFVLQLAALDFHIARMIGLGTMDIANQDENYRFVYLAEYVTYADLEDGLGAREVQHVFCSLPTACTDQRLPLPIDLKRPEPGITQARGTENPTVLTDENGYTFDGKTRFLSLFNEELPLELENKPFFYTNYQFTSANNTLPVQAGIEYRKKGNLLWNKPELPHDKEYFNIDATVNAAQRNESRSIIIPSAGFPLFIHREKTSGWHEFSSYGVNWFSRATSSIFIREIETNIAPTNNLQAPTNVNAVLVVPESPLLFTSANEQIALNNIATEDKTMIRLAFEYNHGQELINYHKSIDGEIINGYQELEDEEEIFANDFEIYFRNRAPISIAGKLERIIPNANPLLVDIQSGIYVLESSDLNETIIPELLGNGSNFIGSLLTVGEDNFLIHQVKNAGDHPRFTVFKNDADGFPIDLNSNIAHNELISPTSGDLFLVVENMLTPSNWSLPNPTISTQLPNPLTSPVNFKVNIEPTAIYREEITRHIPGGEIQTHVQKFRGIYENALIEEELEEYLVNEEDPSSAIMKHLGVYKITFTDFALAQHSQYNEIGNSVEWFKGIVRLHTDNVPNGKRKALKVIRTENIGTEEDLIVYAIDSEFNTDPTYDKVQTGRHLTNYYPDYKTYLFHNEAHNLTENAILPVAEEDMRYSIFGLRTSQNDLNFKSDISQPVLMFARELTEPEQPRLPVGGLYATRPDFFGKASYTFTTVYEHKPHSVQFNRASDIQILSSIYKTEPIQGENDYNVETIMQTIFGNREADWLQERWNNLLSWDYAADNYQFEKLPNDETGVRLPMPNNTSFIASINSFIENHNAYYSENVALIDTVSALNQIVIHAGRGYGELQIVDFMRDIIFNAFVPLTEIPVVYKFIKNSSYTPTHKKQVTRDRNGDLLKPNHPDFDMAPMLKIVDNGNPNHQTQFTDFGLDGASNAMYFYTVKEISALMKTSPYSPVLGPIGLVNTAPPSAPDIVKVIPVLENQLLNINPTIEVRLNAYPKSQNIVKIKLFRAINGNDALSIRTMKMIKELDIEMAGIQDIPIWKIQDDFSDLSFVPYGDPLFYRVVVQRAVKYNDKDGNLIEDLVPSEASKLTLTNMVENTNPNTPELTYYSAPLNTSHELKTVTLSWNKTVHNGAYTIHKMNNSGNWEQIHEIKTNEELIQVQLMDTSLASNILQTKDADENTIYHHFKIVAKNYIGMISREEKILTIYSENTWQNIEDI